MAKNIFEVKYVKFKLCLWIILEKTKNLFFLPLEKIINGSCLGLPREILYKRLAYQVNITLTKRDLSKFIKVQNKLTESLKLQKILK